MEGAKAAQPCWHEHIHGQYTRPMALVKVGSSRKRSCRLLHSGSTPVTHQSGSTRRLWLLRDGIRHSAVLHPLDPPAVPPPGGTVGRLRSGTTAARGLLVPTPPLTRPRGAWGGRGVALTAQAVCRWVLPGALWVGRGSPQCV